MNYKIILLLLSSIFIIPIKSAKDPDGQKYIQAFLNLRKNRNPINNTDINDLQHGIYQVITDCEGIFYLPNPNPTLLTSTNDILTNIENIINQCKTDPNLIPFHQEIFYRQLVRIKKVSNLIRANVPENSNESDNN